MGWQPGQGDGEGGSPDPGAGLPPGRDPRLAVFAEGAPAGGVLPCGRLALVADELSGPGRRCPGATGDELAGLLRAWAAIESWAAGAKLGVIREMMRREAPPSPGADHGDLPETWSASLRHELAGALACSTQSAETLAGLAWEQGARLPGIGGRLEDGTLTHAKARAVVEAFQDLADPAAAQAEALILDQLAGKTHMQVLRLAEQAALTVDPGVAERRRENAQQRARVSLFREQAGTAGLSGRDLPPQEALAAWDCVDARAEEYRDCGAFDGILMDVLRSWAYLDLINGVPARARIAAATPPGDGGPGTGDGDGGDGSPGPSGQDHGPSSPNDASGPSGPGGGGQAGPAGGDPDARASDDEGEPTGGDPGGGDPGSDGDGGDGPGPAPALDPGRRRPADLAVPLATLLGLARRPGEIHRFGPLDPALARQFAAAAAASPATSICVTVTSPEGYAIGHGCARPARTPPLAARPQAGPDGALAPMPARLNLSIPAAALPGLPGPTSRTGPASRHRPDAPNGCGVNGSLWSFTPRGSPPPPADGFGTWQLTIPGGRQFTIRLDPVPTLECDHRYETRGYQPSDRLRHLVQIRDGTCTFPSCNRHARESDFEHGLPYDQGGRTCACNAGARSRACHRVKQSPGWNLTQPRPGWHQWTTPAGRIYTQEPKRYPA